MALEVEREFFQAVRENLLANHNGQFALVFGRELLGTFTTEEEAYRAGLALVGNRPFLIHHVRDEEPVFQAPALFIGIGLGPVA